MAVSLRVCWAPYRNLAPTAGEVAGTLAGAAGVGAAATAGLAVGIAGSAAYGLARGTGWVLENTLFRPQQGSEDAAVQDVRSANGMNDALSLSTSRCAQAAALQAAPQAAAPPHSPASACRNPVAPELAGKLQFRAVTPDLPPPSFDQLARDIEAA